MDNNYENSLVDKAILFASKAHFGQNRKGKDVPYIVHPLEAMSIVASITSDPELIAAAALHDVIEDTKYTYEDLQEKFGKRVADLVKAESDEEVEDISHDKSWQERKIEGIEKIKNATRDIQIVALGDKLANVRDMCRDYKIVGDKLWERFHENDPKLHKWRFTELVDAFKNLEGIDAYDEFKYRVESLFKKY